MSRPRKPFGSSQPGRLPSTMMKVLAAEMSDPQRLRRGKQYAHDGAVIDIVVEEGVVTCEVQGSRPTPYVVSLEVTQGDGMPLRRDLHVECTCPDDDNWNDLACKHAIAAMFTFATELLIEPELLDVWRGREVDGRDAPQRTDPADDDVEEGGDLDAVVDRRADRGSLRRRDRRHLRVVRDAGFDDHGAAGDADLDPDGPDADADADAGADVGLGEPDVYALAAAVPEGASIPEIPILERVEFPLPRQRELAAVLRSAADAMRLDWD